MTDDPNPDLDDLPHDQLAMQALALAWFTLHDETLAGLAIDLHDACDAGRPSADLARRVIGRIDALYEAHAAAKP